MQNWNLLLRRKREIDFRKYASTAVSAIKYIYSCHFSLSLEIQQNLLPKCLALDTRFLRVYVSRVSFKYIFWDNWLPNPDNRILMRA
jgi:hypothetical protein